MEMGLKAEDSRIETQAMHGGAERADAVSPFAAKFTSIRACATIRAFAVDPDGRHFRRYFRLLRARPAGILQQAMLHCGVD